MNLITSLSRSLAGSVAGPLSGPGAGAGDTIEDILGDLLVEYWDCRYGISLVAGEVDSWTGQAQGTVLPAPSSAKRPGYAVDGGFFGGHPVVLFERTTGRRLDANPLPAPILAAGTRPYCVLVGRERVTLTEGAASCWYTLQSTSVFVISECGVYNASALSHGLFCNHRNANTNNFAEPVGVWDAYVPITLETVSDASGFHVLQDGAQVTSASGGTSADPLSNDVIRVQLGSNWVDSQRANLSCAQFIVCSELPSDAQRSALRALLGETWMAPTGTYVVAGGDLVTAGGQIVGGS